MRNWLPVFIFCCCTLSIGLAQAQSPSSDPEALTDLRVAQGNKNISKAWLISPTQRYRHFVQGSQYEAAGLRVALADGQVVTLMLDEAHVFEDRQPRLADLDGDGRDEVVVVLSSVTKGASLAAYSVINGALKMTAQTPFIGRPNRWLNPAGIADFDGDGRMDVALVAMPHLAKRLELWSLSNGNFVRWGAFDGYSNHRNGSVHIGMSSVADFDGDGIQDLALPNSSRDRIEFVSLKDRSLSTIGSAPLPTSVDGPFTPVPGGVTVRLSNGKSVTVKP